MRAHGTTARVPMKSRAFTCVEQTEPLAGLLLVQKVRVPVVALGGEKGLGPKNAYAIVASGELRPYGNVLIKEMLR